MFLTFLIDVTNCLDFNDVQFKIGHTRCSRQINVFSAPIINLIMFVILLSIPEVHRSSD